MTDVGIKYDRFFVASVMGGRRQAHLHLNYNERVSSFRVYGALGAGRQAVEKQVVKVEY
jgi:hypothetical protein